MVNQITIKREDLNTSLTNRSSWPKEMKLVSLTELIHNRGTRASIPAADHKILIPVSHTSSIRVWVIEVCALWLTALTLIMTGCERNEDSCILLVGVETIADILKSILPYQGWRYAYPVILLVDVYHRETFMYVCKWIRTRTFLEAFYWTSAKLEVT